MFPVYTLEEMLELLGLSEIGEAIIAVRNAIKKAIETGKRQCLFFEGEEYRVDSEARIYDKGDKLVLDCSNSIDDFR